MANSKPHRPLFWNRISFRKSRKIAEISVKSTTITIATSTHRAIAHSITTVFRAISQPIFVFFFFIVLFDYRAGSVLFSVCICWKKKNHWARERMNESANEWISESVFCRPVCCVRVCMRAFVSVSVNVALRFAHFTNIYVLSLKSCVHCLLTSSVFFVLLHTHWTFFKSFHSIVWKWIL